MNATSYLPHQLPQIVPADGLVTPDPVNGFVGVPEQVSALMGCAPKLVDVLVSGAGYVVYSIFDHEGPINYAAMAAVSSVSGVMFDPDDECAVLCGVILMVTDN